MWTGICSLGHVPRKWTEGACVTYLCLTNFSRCLFLQVRKITSSRCEQQRSHSWFSLTNWCSSGILDHSPNGHCFALALSIFSSSFVQYKCSQNLSKLDLCTNLDMAAIVHFATPAKSLPLGLLGGCCYYAQAATASSSRIMKLSLNVSPHETLVVSTVGYPIRYFFNPAVSADETRIFTIGIAEKGVSDCWITKVDSLTDSPPTIHYAILQVYSILNIELSTGTVSDHQIRCKWRKRVARR